MSLAAYTAVWTHSRQKHSTLLVLLAIAEHANDDGVSFPGIEELSRKARITERNVYRCLEKAKDSGELNYFSGESPYGTNLYQIILPGLHPDKLTPLEAQALLVPAEGTPISTHDPDKLSPKMSPEPIEDSLIDSEDSLNDLGDKSSPELSGGSLKSKISKQEYDAWKYAGVPFGMFQGEIDVSHFPADVSTTIERFVRLWGVPVPPAKTGQYSDWIKGARELMTAYGNYGPELLDLVFWRGGTKDMTIGRPAGLVQFVSDMHGQLFRKRTHRDKLPGLIEHEKANTENGQRLIESVEEKQKALREELGLADDEFLKPSA